MAVVFHSGVSVHFLEFVLSLREQGDGFLDGLRSTDRAFSIIALTVFFDLHADAGILVIVVIEMLLFHVVVPFTLGHS